MDTMPASTSLGLEYVISSVDYPCERYDIYEPRIYNKYLKNYFRGPIVRQYQQRYRPTVIRKHHPGNDRRVNKMKTYIKQLKRRL